jgi:adenosylcobinamide-GDP ribazoletransferase
MIKKELQILGSSILYFSRLPVPIKIPYNKEHQQKSLTWLPLVGLIVGGTGALVFYSFSFFLPQAISVILAFSAMVLTTGAFHEDGFADVCDAFGGGYSKDQRLTIMKDSRIGAYAAIGLILLFLLKILALAEINSEFLSLVIISSQAMSRWPLLIITKLWKYARQSSDSKSVDTSKQLSIIRILFALVLSSIPLFLFQNWIVFLSIPLLVIVSLLFGSWFNKKIDGYTGDCLGAVQQVNELVFYIFFLALHTNGILQVDL